MSAPARTAARERPATVSSKQISGLTSARPPAMGMTTGPRPGVHETPAGASRCRKVSVLSSGMNSPNGTRCCLRYVASTTRLVPKRNDELNTTSAPAAFVDVSVPPARIGARSSAAKASIAYSISGLGMLS